MWPYLSRKIPGKDGSWLCSDLLRQVTWYPEPICGQRDGENLVVWTIWLSLWSGRRWAVCAIVLKQLSPRVSELPPGCPVMGVRSRWSQDCTEFNLLEIYQQKHDLQVDLYNLGQTTFTTWGFLQQSGQKWLHSSWNVPGLSQANIKESGIFLAPGSSPPVLHTTLMDLAIYGMLRNYLWETNQDYSRVIMTAITQYGCCQITLNP